MPKNIKNRPWHFYSGQFKTPVGRLCLSATLKGLYALDWVPPSLRARPRSCGGRSNLSRDCFVAPPKSVARLLAMTVCEIHKYFSRRLNDFKKLPVDWSGVPPFERKVLQILRKLPRGRTATYQSLAAKAGRPKAARYIGRIMNRNRLPLVIPCHRIVPKAGGLGGFSGGVRLKRRLLKLERAAVDKKRRS